MGLIPGQGTKIPHAPGQLSCAPHGKIPHATTKTQKSPPKKKEHHPFITGRDCFWLQLSSSRDCVSGQCLRLPQRWAHMQARGPGGLIFMESPATLVWHGQGWHSAVWWCQRDMWSPGAEHPWGWTRYNQCPSLYPGPEETGLEGKHLKFAYLPQLSQSLESTIIRRFLSF